MRREPRVEGEAQALEDCDGRDVRRVEAGNHGRRRAAGLSESSELGNAPACAVDTRAKEARESEERDVRQGQEQA